MCHCTEYKLSALKVRILEENKLNVTTQQFITVKITGFALKWESKTHSSMLTFSTQTLTNFIWKMLMKVRPQSPCLINDAIAENDVSDTISCQCYNSGHFIEYTKQLTTKDLFMVLSNVTSLNKNLCDLQQYLSELYYEPDIIAISETIINSTNSHLPDHQMHGYTFFHCDSTTKAVGVDAYIKNTIDAKHIHDLSKSFDGCESLWIEVGFNKENAIVGVVYRHPHSDMSVFQESIMQTLHKLTVNKKIYMLWEILTLIC